MKVRVDCLMPTLPARLGLRLRAVRSFTKQNVPESWEVSLSLCDSVEDTLGAKINRMVERSRADFFVLLDDDDWHGRNRVHDQVAPLVRGRFDYSGSSLLYYFDVRSEVAYTYRGDGAWLGGLAFTRAIWERCKFLDKSAGVDYLWQRSCPGRKIDLFNPRLFVASIHDHNTCQKYTAGKEWTRIPVSALPDEFLADEFFSLAQGGVAGETPYVVGERSGCGVA